MLYRQYYFNDWFPNYHQLHFIYIVLPYMHTVRLGEWSRLSAAPGISQFMHDAPYDCLLIIKSHLSCLVDTVIFVMVITRWAEYRKKFSLQIPTEEDPGQWWKQPSTAALLKHFGINRGVGTWLVAGQVQQYQPRRWRGARNSAKTEPQVHPSNTAGCGVSRSKIKKKASAPTTIGCRAVKVS